MLQEFESENNISDDIIVKLLSLLGNIKIDKHIKINNLYMDKNTPPLKNNLDLKTILLKNSQPHGRSPKTVLKKMFSRIKRDNAEKGKLILRHPSIFENIRKETQKKEKEQTKSNI